MDNRSEAGAGFRRYELVGGLVFLGLFLTDLIPAALRWITARLFGTADPVRSTLILNLAFDVLCLAVLLPLLHRWLGGQLRQLRSNGLRQTLRHLLVGAGLILAAMLVMSYLITVVTMFHPEYSNPNQESLELLYANYPFWITLMTVLTAPLIEELLFRGLLFGAIRPRSRFWAYLVSSLLFAVPHVSAYLFFIPAAISAVNLLFYCSMGLILARVCERSGTVCTSVLLHALYNTLVTLLIR